MVKSQVTRFLLVTPVFLILVFSSITIVRSQSNENTLVSKEALIQPTIDGVISSDEWGEASLTTIFQFPTGTDYFVDDNHTVNVYIMNDKKNLYIGITLDNEDYNTSDSYDEMSIYFDSDHDGIHDGSEDSKSISDLDEYEDFNSNADGSGTSDGSRDGRGKATHSNHEIGTYSYEFEIPLDSGDKNDISVSPGDSLGIFIEFYEFEGTFFIASGFVNDNWPQSAESYEMETYGILELATSIIEPTYIPEKDSNDGFLDVNLFFGFILLLFTAKYRKAM